MANIKTPILNYHIEHKAKLGQYGGWEMVSDYASFNEEYNAIRENLGLLDISCITKVRVKGEFAQTWLDGLCTGNVLSLSEGKSLYTCCCDGNGFIIAFVQILQDADEYLIFADPAKRRILFKWLNQNLKSGIIIEDISEKFACFSVIGPKATEIPKGVISEDVIGLPYLGFEHDKIDNINVILYRFGLTGEFEYLFFVPAESAEIVWKKIIEYGRQYNIQLCGLNILNILLLEMKSVSDTEDIKANNTLLQAGLHWMVQFSKEKFVGKEALTLEKQKGVTLNLISFMCAERNGIKKNSNVYMSQERVGEVVHTGYSLILNREIGLAYIDAKFAVVGLEFGVETVNSERKKITTVSAPLFITNSIKGIRE